MFFSLIVELVVDLAYIDFRDRYETVVFDEVVKKYVK